tara:strand:+ start:218 stop:418 length:201 start_codon:yes stop_codon:yes gene_type:complete
MEKKVRILVGEDYNNPDKDSEEEIFLEEDEVEELVNTFGKGVKKRKMLVTKGITLKDLYLSSKEGN